MIRYTVLGAFFMLLPFYELRGTDNKNNKKKWECMQYSYVFEKISLEVSVILLYKQNLKRKDRICAIAYYVTLILCRLSVLK